MRALLLLLCLITFSACSLTTPDDGTLDATGLLQTDATSYTAETVTDGRTYVSARIPYETFNATGEALYLIGCNVPPSAVLEKSVGGAWVTAYSPGTGFCLSAPWVIASGETRRDTLVVRGYLPGQNITPTFDTEVEGTYRLRRTIHTGRADESASLGVADLEPMQSVSNTFELR